MSNGVIIVYPMNCVSLISKDLIYLESVSEDVIKAVAAINARIDVLEGRTIWKIFYSNKLELVEKLRELNELGFLFAGGPHGWPPA